MSNSIERWIFIKPYISEHFTNANPIAVGSYLEFNENRWVAYSSDHKRLGPRFTSLTALKEKGYIELLQSDKNDEPSVATGDESSNADGNKKENRCCGRCDGVNDECVADMICEEHDIRGCEMCFGERLANQITNKGETADFERLSYNERLEKLIQLQEDYNILESKYSQAVYARILEGETKEPVLRWVKASETKVLPTDFVPIRIDGYYNIARFEVFDDGANGIFWSCYDRGDERIDWNWSEETKLMIEFLEENQAPVEPDKLFPDWNEAIKGIDDSRFDDMPNYYAVREGARIMYDRLYGMLNSEQSVKVSDTTKSNQGEDAD